MWYWRWRTCRCSRKFLITVLVVTAIGLVILMGVVEQALPNTRNAEEGARSKKPKYSSPDGHTSHDLSGPGTVVAMVEGSKKNLLERLLNGRSDVMQIVSLNMSSPVEKDIMCFHTKTDPIYTICPHPTTQDRHISNQLMEDGIWQARTLALLPIALKHYPSSTLLDIGAHVGVFSLLGARLGAAVVAVEPVWASAVHLHAGAVKGNVSRSVKIILHAVTHQPMHVKFKHKEGNLGGTSVVEVTPHEAEFIRSSGHYNLATSITLDSLAPFINTSVIILKIDSEGRECEAISSGRSLLTSHFTPYIFMEWSVMANNRHKYMSPCAPTHIQEMVDWLTAQDYHPHISKSGATLNPAKVELWRAGDIYWRHSTAPSLHPLPR